MFNRGVEQGGVEQGDGFGVPEGARELVQLVQGLVQGDGSGVPVTKLTREDISSKLSYHMLRKAD